MTVIEQMLQKYASNTQEDKTQALREVMQEIALAGLYRGGFFEKAAFYGGTCLRTRHDSIFYQLHLKGNHEYLLEDVLEQSLKASPELGQGTMVGVRVACQKSKGN